MAVNFPDSPSDGDTFTSSNITFVYSSSKGVWSQVNPYNATNINSTVDSHLNTSTATTNQILAWDGSDYDWVEDGGGITVYATIDDLPLSGPSTGDQAFVSGNNRLYLWNGTGWYNIALINTSPSISNVQSSYVLSSEGANTVISIVAEDPEGIPITYSLVSDTSGNTATVTQGTGNTANEFIITPSTNQGDAGTFSLTFRASDGVNIASAISEFTLVFQVVNSNYTTALITSTGTNNQVNNTFVDSSTNSHTITAAGNVTQNTFSPYRHGGNAVSFAGTNSSSENYLWINAAIVPATGSWTYESWVRVDRKSDGERHSLISWYTNGASGRGNIFVRADNETNPGIVFVYVDGMSTYPQSTTRVDDGAWHHVVVERDGNVWSVWIDGTRENQETQNVTLNTSVNTRLGHIINTAATSHSGFKGLMRDVRFSTSARYQGAASINVPTEDQTTTTGYALLCCQSFNPFIDKTGTREITVYSSTSVKQVGAGPYDTKTYSATDHSGSMYFDGSGDYLSAAYDAGFNMGATTDFTMEAWVYQINQTGNHTIFAQYNGSGTSHSPTNGHRWIFWIDDGKVQLYQYPDMTTQLIDSGTINLNTWNHVAVTREGSVFRLFVNGIEVDTLTSSTVEIGFLNDPLTVGSYNSTGFFNGIISDVRVVKGTAVYTSNFTPPIAPLTAITNTSLLVQGTNAGIIDKSQSVKTITLNGDVKSSTTQTKYLSSSIYFDGTGDYLTLSADAGLHIDAIDFTFEFWIYPMDVSVTESIFVRRASATARGMVSNINGSSANKFTVLFGDTDNAAWEVTLTTTSNLTSQNWHHIAIVRSGNNFYLYLDGTQEATATWAGTIADDTEPFIIGSNGAGTDFTGYLSDIRITKGLARYTSNFTPPTAALQG